MVKFLIYVGVLELWDNWKCTCKVEILLESVLWLGHLRVCGITKFDNVCMLFQLIRVSQKKSAVQKHKHCQTWLFQQAMSTNLALKDSQGTCTECHHCKGHFHTEGSIHWNCPGWNHHSQHQTQKLASTWLSSTSFHQHRWMGVKWDIDDLTECCVQGI